MQNKLIRDMSSMLKEEDSFNIFLVDNAAEFHKSLQELRDLGSQLYQAADYSVTSFLSAEDKRIVVENTKRYISMAIVAVADHLGSISSNLETCDLLNSSSIPQTQHKVDILKQRILTCQQNSHKLAQSRFYLSCGVLRHHCRYILPPAADSARMNVLSRNSNGGKREKGESFETEEPLFLHTYNCKPSLVETSAWDLDKNNGLSPPVMPVRGDGLSILPKSEESIFKFQEAQKIKRSMINWKQLQNKEIKSLIRRGKRILA